MSTYLYNLARWAFSHRRIVLASWLVVAIAAVAAAILSGGKTNDNFTIPGTEAQNASNLLSKKVPALAGGQTQIVLATSTGDLTADEMAYFPRFRSGHWERGWLLDAAWHLVLPVFCLSYGSFAVLSKLARGAVLDNINADYARTARAKGVSGRDVLYRHVFRNSLLPLITVATEILPSLVGGAVIVETIFGLPGMGKLAVDAVFQKDPELVLSETVVVSFLTLISYLVADILYAVADPRVSYE